MEKERLKRQEETRKATEDEARKFALEILLQETNRSKRQRTDSSDTLTRSPSKLKPNQRLTIDIEDSIELDTLRAENTKLKTALQQAQEDLSKAKEEIIHWRDMYHMILKIFTSSQKLLINTYF